MRLQGLVEQRESDLQHHRSVLEEPSLTALLSQASFPIVSILNLSLIAPNAILMLILMFGHFLSLIFSNYSLYFHRFKCLNIFTLWS